MDSDCVGTSTEPVEKGEPGTFIKAQVEASITNADTSTKGAPIISNVQESA